MATGKLSKTAAATAGKLLMIGLERPELDREATDLLEEISPLGVILFARNMPGKAEVLTLTATLHDLDPGLIVAIDHEGGRVDRCPEGFTRFPAALRMAAHGDPHLLKEVGKAHARELRAAGFDLNFAPVLDVHTNPDNPVIGDRAFGTTPEEVIHNALPYAMGLAEGGILACAKHFPGHGDTAADSHVDLPKLAAQSHTLSRLRGLEMKPFARAVAQGLPMMMTAHIVCEALDAERPATLSPQVIDALLRRELGFRGVIVSDDLEMAAIAEHYEPGQAAVEAILAGCDLLLCCRRPGFIRQAHAGLAAAIENGIIARGALAAIDKRRSKLLSRLRKLRKFAVDPDAPGCAAHRSLAARLA